MATSIIAMSSCACPHIPLQRLKDGKKKSNNGLLQQCLVIQQIHRGIHRSPKCCVLTKLDVFVWSSMRMPSMRGPTAAVKHACTIGSGPIRDSTRAERNALQASNHHLRSFLPIYFLRLLFFMFPPAGAHGASGFLSILPGARLIRDKTGCLHFNSSELGTT